MRNAEKTLKYKKGKTMIDKKINENINAGNKR